jgi:putative PIG3 family NAD(P)H quinone oxidoreductase
MTLPETMRAVIHGPDAPLRVEEVACPRPRPGQVLIKTAAAGMNRPDLFQRLGLYPPPPGASPILGLEVAGHVAAVGEGVARWREGDAVCALLGGGGYAEYAVASAGSVMPAPQALNLIEAAAIPETTLTVWANVFESGALKPGETLLVHGGASGIGTTAIQLAKAHGARVFTTAGDEAKLALCARLGAERAIAYKTEDFETILTGVGGADVILDMVGGPYIQKNINLLKEHGRLVFIAFLQGPQAELNLMRVMLKHLTITGSTLRNRPEAEKARLAQAVEAAVFPWIAAGRYKPVIDTVLPLEQADTGMNRLQAMAHAGKIILTP